MRKGFRYPKTGVTTATVTATAEGATGGQAGISLLGSDGGITPGRDFWLREMFFHPSAATKGCNIIIQDSSVGSTYAAASVKWKIYVPNGTGATGPRIVQKFAAPGLKFTTDVVVFLGTTTTMVLQAGGCGAIGYEE